MSRVFPARAAGRERLTIFGTLKESGQRDYLSRAVGVLCLGGGTALSDLLVGVADEQGFHLTQKIAGAERFDEQRFRVLSAPIFTVPLLSIPLFAGWRISREQSGRGIVSLPMRGAKHFQARLFGFHAQVADHHLVNAGLHADKSFRGTGGSVDGKSVEFENGLEGQQHGEIVVDNKNAAFHGAPLTGDLEMQCSAESVRSGCRRNNCRDSDRWELQPQHPFV